MITYHLAPPQGPRGRDQKNYAVACVIYVSSSHTKFGWIPEKNMFDPNPPWTPSSPTTGA